MESKTFLFNEHEVLHTLKHYLPAQAPLKDFIHHNTLHAFQNLKFYKALRNASGIFGYKTSLGLDEFRAHYASGRIREDVLEKVIIDKFGRASLEEWKLKLIFDNYDTSCTPRVGTLRANWDKHYNLDLDLLTHPILFRTICSYLDQGISIWNFPVLDKGFLNSIREMEKHQELICNPLRTTTAIRSKNQNRRQLLGCIGWQIHIRGQVNAIGHRHIVSGRLDGLRHDNCREQQPQNGGEPNRVFQVVYQGSGLLTKRAKANSVRDLFVVGT